MENNFLINNEINTLKEEQNSTQSILYSTKLSFARDMVNNIGPQMRKDLTDTRKPTLWQRIKWKLFKRI